MSKKDQPVSDTTSSAPTIIEGEEQNKVKDVTNPSSDQAVANINADTANARAGDDSAEHETLTEAELARWSKERYLAGQHEAAANVQKRYEALVRKNNRGRTVVFSRNPENGDLTFEASKTQEELKKEEDEKNQAARKEEESRKRIEEAQKREDEKARGNKK